MKNLPHLLYRLDAYANMPTVTSVKGKPLTSLEIDGNFRSVYKSLESIPDIVTNQNIDDGADLDDLVDHKAMVYYVDKEISDVTAYIDSKINNVQNSVEVVTNDDIWHGVEMDKYIDHKAMLFYKEFTSQASYWIDNINGSDVNDGRSESFPWRTLAPLTEKLPAQNGIYITVNLRTSPNPYSLTNDIAIVHSDLVFQRYGDYTAFPTLTSELTFDAASASYKGASILAFSSKVRVMDVNIASPSVPASYLRTYSDFGDLRYVGIKEYGGLMYADTHSTVYFHASEPQKRINITINDGLIVSGGEANKIIMHSCYIEKKGTGYIMWPSSQHLFYEWNCRLAPGTTVTTYPSASNLSGTNPSTDIFWYAVSDFPVAHGLLPASYTKTAGFQKFAGGFIMQWGTLVKPNNVTEYVFPIAFDDILSVTCSYVDTTDSNESPVLLPIDGTKFKVKTQSINSSINYIAIGVANRVYPAP